ncbi:MAG: hypothetical protein ACKV2O_16770 [Acidimicrobiales bacterium]
MSPPLRRLLVIDPAGVVALNTLDATDGTDRQVLSARPPSAPGRASTQVRTAVWSPAGQWAAVALDSDDLDGPREVRLHHVGSGPSAEDDQPNADAPAASTVIADGVTAFYLCPSPCGRFLSHLSPGPLGLELALSEVGSGALRIIERGQPLYWAWRPDSSELAVHVAQRALRVPLDGPPTELTDDAGSFLAPWWTPQGSVVIAHDERVVAHHADATTTELAASATSGRFSLDPQGQRVALVELIEGEPCLVVINVMTGERDIVTVERAAAFFWSPDGRRLAALVMADARRLQWIVFDGEADQAESVQRLQPFRPGVAWLRQVLPFFEQYSHSHAVWSPDGTELVAPALDADGSTEAVIQQAVAPFASEHLPGVQLAWWAAPTPTGPAQPDNQPDN